VATIDNCSTITAEWMLRDGATPTAPRVRELTVKARFSTTIAAVAPAHGAAVTVLRAIAISQNASKRSGGQPRLDR
jgi:hypothetical protein